MPPPPGARRGGTESHFRLCIFVLVVCRARKKTYPLRIILYLLMTCRGVSLFVEESEAWSNADSTYSTLTPGSRCRRFLMTLWIPFFLSKKSFRYSTDPFCDLRNVWFLGSRARALWSKNMSFTKRKWRLLHSVICDSISNPLFSFFVWWFFPAPRSNSSTKRLPIVRRTKHEFQEENRSSRSAKRLIFLNRKGLPFHFGKS